MRRARVVGESGALEVSVVCGSGYDFFETLPVKKDAIQFAAGSSSRRSYSPSDGIRRKRVRRSAREGYFQDHVKTGC